MLDFEFTCFNEDIIIVGMKGGGKTYLANEILHGLTNIPVIVFDFNWGFHDSRAVVVDDISGAGASGQPLHHEAAKRSSGEVFVCLV